MTPPLLHEPGWRGCPDVVLGLRLAAPAVEEAAVAFVEAVSSTAV